VGRLSTKCGSLDGLLRRQLYYFFVTTTTATTTAAAATTRILNIPSYGDNTIGWDGVDWIDLAQDRGQWRALVNTVMNLRVP
jgi:hypothetical protein